MTGVGAYRSRWVQGIAASPSPESGSAPFSRCLSPRDPSGFADSIDRSVDSALVQRISDRADASTPRRRRERSQPAPPFVTASEKQRAKPS